jgi:hypothetical protein
MFVDHFAGSETPESITFPEANTMTDVLDDEFGDIGVSRMKTRSTDELVMMLGFADGRPAHWAKLRCSDPAITSWDAEYVSKYVLTDEGAHKDGMSRLSLLWHQLVGIASMADQAWTKNEATMPGFILADDVGIGKTAQVMGLIALVQQVWMIENNDVGGVRPPLIGKQTAVRLLFRLSLHQSWISLFFQRRNPSSWDKALFQIFPTSSLCRIRWSIRPIEN